MVARVTDELDDPNPCPCQLCRPGCDGHTGDNRPVCQNCRDRLRATLNDIPDLYTALDDELLGQGGKAGPKVSGTREAPIPGRLDVLNLRGPGSTANMPIADQHGAIPVFAALESWERDWRHCRGLPITGVWPDLPTALTSIVRFLDAHLDWAADNHGAIDEFAGDVRGVRQSIKAAQGDRPDTVAIGNCPILDDAGKACGAKLRASTWHDTIRCPACRTVWERAEWERLGLVMGGRGGAA